MQCWQELGGLGGAVCSHAPPLPRSEDAQQPSEPPLAPPAVMGLRHPKQTSNRAGVRPRASLCSDPLSLGTC